MVEIEIEKGVCIVIAQSNFTRDDLNSIIDFSEEHEGTGIVLDLERLGLLTSSTLGLLIQLFKYTQEASCKFGVTGLDVNGKRTLGFAKLDSMFSQFDSHEEGIEAFSKS